MTKREFFDLYGYLQELYDLKDLSKRGYEAWFKIFEKIDYDVANKMVDLYFLNKTKKPKPADLLQYKSYAYRELNKTQVMAEKAKCELCNGLGIIIKEKLINNKIYEVGNLCDCANASNYNLKDVKVVDINELSGYGRLTNGKFVFTKQEEIEKLKITTEDLLEKMSF